MEEGGIGLYLVYLAAEGFIYFGLVFLVDSQLFGQIRHHYARRRYMKSEMVYSESRKNNGIEVRNKIHIFFFCVCQTAKVTISFHFINLVKLKKFWNLLFLCIQTILVIIAIIIILKSLKIFTNCSYWQNLF